MTAAYRVPPPAPARRLARGHIIAIRQRIALGQPIAAWAVAELLRLLDAGVDAERIIGEAVLAEREAIAQMLEGQPRWALTSEECAELVRNRPRP